MLPEHITDLAKKLYRSDEFGVEFADLNAKPDPELLSYFKENFGIHTDVHRMCQNCQIRQLIKYANLKNDLYDPNKFLVNCKYVPAGLPPGSKEKARKIATERGIDLARAERIMLAAIDPVAWAEVMFGFDDNRPEEEGKKQWKLRPHQKEVLRCTSNRMVLRQGRRSGKSFAICLKLLERVFNMTITKGYDSSGRHISAGPEIIIITPFQSQIDNLFEQMDKLLRSNTDLMAAVTSSNTGNLYTKTPFYNMKFNNGAIISGFVSGVGGREDGSAGGAIRGDSCNILYLDEMDMISEEVLKKVAAPLLMTGDDVLLYASSTPIGKLASFYHWSLARPDFREFYYPSTVLEHWPKLRTELISEVGEEGIKTEILAQFVDGSFGAFKPSLIHEARANYIYSETQTAEFWREKIGVLRPHEIIYSMGIDWNKNAGSEFYVTGFDPVSGKLFGVDATNIAASEMSGQDWMEEVMRLNYKWKPQFIYADEGYGHTVIEELRLASHRAKFVKNPTAYDVEVAKLGDRLKSYNFSSNVDLRDPVSNKVFSKPAKLYMIETAIRIFEQHRIWFPETDKVLTAQLASYAVLKLNAQTGKPVYGPSNSKIADHRLDAFMLSLVAFYLERSVYAMGGYSYNSPTVLERELDQDDGFDRGMSGAGLVNMIQKHRIPTVLSILELQRGAGQEAEDNARKTLIGQDAIKSGRFHGKRGRGSETVDVSKLNIPSKEYDLDREGLWAYNALTAKRAKRSTGGRSGRGIR